MQHATLAFKMNVDLSIDVSVEIKVTEAKDKNGIGRFIFKDGCCKELGSSNNRIIVERFQVVVIGQNSSSFHQRV